MLREWKIDNCVWLSAILKRMGKNGNKTKSYQIQRGFLLLFIFLDYQVGSSSRTPSDLPNVALPHALRLFRRFCSMGYATKFYQNLDDVCIAKASDQNLSQQLSRTSSLLSSSLVASDNECPKATFLQTTSLIEVSNRHQGAVFWCV